MAMPCVGAAARRGQFIPIVSPSGLACRWIVSLAHSPISHHCFEDRAALFSQLCFYCLLVANIQKNNLVVGIFRKLIEAARK